MKNKTSRIMQGCFLFGLAFVFGLVFGQYNAEQPVANAEWTAVPDTDLKAISAQLDKFFENLSDTNIGSKTALQELLKSSPNRDEQAIAGLSALWEQGNGFYGSYLSFEMIDSKMVGKDLIFVRYLYKYQNRPIVWSFTFYRVPSSSTDAATRPWMVISADFSSNLELLRF